MKAGKTRQILIVVMTLVLSVVSAVSGFLLYKNRKVAVAPTAPSQTQAATTTTISDNFDGGNIDGKWAVYSGQGREVTQTNGKLIAAITPEATIGPLAGVMFNKTVIGDWNVKVSVEGFEATTGPDDSAVAEIELYGDVGNRIALRWTKSQSVNGFYLYGKQNDVLFETTKRAASGNGPFLLQIRRVDNIVYASIDNSLIGSQNWVFAGNQTIFVKLSKEGRISATSQSSVKFDNFEALVNLTNAPVPTPGTPEACTVSFTVLDVPTADATPTPTPTPTPSPTPTPPAGEPNNCGGTCGSNANCKGGLFCYEVAPGKSYCRNPNNPTSETCEGGVSQPTPTPTLRPSGPTPTPVTLEEAGSVTGTWIVTVAGAVLLILGTLAVFAL